MMSPKRLKKLTLLSGFFLYATTLIKYKEIIFKVPSLHITNKETMEISGIIYVNIDIRSV